MTNSETKNFSQNVSSSYHLEDRGKCNKNTCTNARNVPKLRFQGYNDEWKGVKLKNISSITEEDLIVNDVEEKSGLLKKLVKIEVLNI